MGFFFRITVFNEIPAEGFGEIFPSTNFSKGMPNVTRSMDQFIACKLSRRPGYGVLKNERLMNERRHEDYV